MLLEAVVTVASSKNDPIYERQIKKPVQSIHVAHRQRKDLQDERGSENHDEEK